MLLQEAGSVPVSLLAAIVLEEEGAGTKGRVTQGRFVQSGPLLLWQSSPVALRLKLHSGLSSRTQCH
jgi:hypothetical protein